MSTSEWRRKNPEKLREYRRNWYHRNSKKAIEKVAERKRSVKEWFRSYKEKLTCHCGESFWACLDFHHLDPKQKVKSLSLAVSYGWSIERLKTEIDKCGVLCANCHRKETFGYDKFDV
jgi:hypothetical protein